MKKYRIVYGYNSDIITVEDWECEQDAVDKLIDKLEAEGCTGCFINPSETSENGGDYGEDMYITGGNHGLLLYHGGNFMIQEIN